MPEHYTMTLTTDGSGDATDNLFIVGYLEAVKVDYGADADAGTDLVIADDQGRTLISMTNSVTDAWHYPAVQATASDGSAISGVYRRYMLNGRVTATIAQGGDTKTSTVTFYWSNE